MEAVLFRQLLPPGDAIDSLSYVDALQVAPHRDDRPYVIANFVASVDGRATVDERSRKLSGPADRELFYALRERVDAVLIGTGTLAADHYKRMLPQQERRERRIAAGRREEPFAVTVTRSGNVPCDIPLFDEPDRVLVFEDKTLDEMLETLRHEHHINTLLCEGGPTLFGALLRAGLVDELFLTLAPMLVGGASDVGGVSGGALLSGPPLETSAKVKLRAVLERDSALFLRYSL